MDANIKDIMEGKPLMVYAMQNPKYGWVSFSSYEDISGYVCVGKAEVTFTPVDQEEVVTKACDMLDQKIKDVYAKAELEIGQIKDQKARLLSLRHMPEGE